MLSLTPTNAHVTFDLFLFVFVAARRIGLALNLLFFRDFVGAQNNININSTRLKSWSSTRFMFMMKLFVTRHFIRVRQAGALLVGFL